MSCSVDLNKDMIPRVLSTCVDFLEKKGSSHTNYATLGTNVLYIHIYSVLQVWMWLAYSEDRLQLPQFKPGRSNSTKVQHYVCKCTYTYIRTMCVSV